MKVSKLILLMILFLLLSTAAWAASPVIFYSDLTAGPNTGGQNNNGVFVTIWGNNFGSTQGSSYVTVGGGQVNNYPTWTNTMICFQLGPNVSTGNIVLVTSNGNATGPSFKVQAGNIYFVQPGAASNGSGTYASPFNHLYYYENIANPGDTVYVMAGTIGDEVDGHSGWHSVICPERGGIQGSPVSWIAYPNATVTFSINGGTATWTDGSSGGSDKVSYIFRGFTNWHTISKFYMVFTGSSTNLEVPIDDTYNTNGVSGDGWKIVGNNITAPSYSDEAIIAFSGNYSQVLGNEVHDSSEPSMNNEAHAIYWANGGNPGEIGWNYMHGNSNIGWEIQLFHMGYGSEPAKVGSIHDNLIIASSAGADKGILLGDVDSGETQSTVETQNIKIYNNVIVNAGQSGNGGSIQAVSGTGYIYNNTIYGSGTENEGMIQFPSGGIGPGGGHPVWSVANNIIYNSIAGSLYLSDGNGNAPDWSNFALLTNNNYYGAGNGPSEDAKPVNANPQFVSNGTNFQLQATSPDINAGYNTTAIVTEDLSGLLRSTAPTIGAYEYTGASVLPSSPVVSITNPSSGSTGTAGTNITITTTAFETNGTIRTISLYNGVGVLLGSGSTSPYNYVMTNAAVGIYSFTAVATDANGVSTTSSPSIITVVPAPVLPSPPVVSITSPTSGSSYTAGSNVTITTTASETNGTISNISLYNGSGILLGSSSTSPYNYVDSNMAAGSYTFYAIAKDVNGVSTTSSSITLTVTAPSSPVVSITSPSSGSNYTAGSSISITANASESNGSISQVQFYNGSTLLGTDSTSPYNYTWTSVPAGSYSLTVKATDGNGVTTTSSAVTVTVATAPSSPVVSITSPSSGSNYTAGSSISITANASESNGSISQVQFYNGSTLLGTDSTSPYNYTWTSVPAGSYSLTVKATDGNGVTTTSSAVTVTVATAPSSPVVSITSPSSGSNYTAGSSISITANASESNGSISQVQFYNGSTLLGTDSTSPYNYTWTSVPAGSYSLTVKATDGNGVTTTSSAVTVTVATAPSSPVVSITSPSSGSNYTAGSSISITANASESNGSISQVQFYNGSTLLGTDSTSPYNYTWTSVPAGSYSLTAKATDGNGVTTTSSAITVTVTTSSVAPSITTQPVSVTVTAPATATFSVAVTGTPSPSYQWQQEASGSRRYTSISGATTASYTTPATTTSNNGTKYECVVSNASGSVTSSAATLTVSSPVTNLPVVAITSPANNSTLKAGSNMTITASASETNGTIATVFFYNGTTLLGSSSASPYSYTLTNISAGTYNLTAMATDKLDNATTSSPIIVTVTSPPAAPSITTQPVSQTVTAPATATFSVAATGTPAPSYQWMQSINGGGFTAISGATSSSYTTTATTTANSGTQYECVVSNPSGSVTSSPAVLTVNVNLIFL